jgi:hypothetical protein
MLLSPEPSWIAVGTALAGSTRTESSVRDYRAGLLPWVRVSKRMSGKGCITRVGGSHRFAMRFIRVQLMRVRWL